MERETRILPPSFTTEVLDRITLLERGHEDLKNLLIEYKNIGEDMQEYVFGLQAYIVANLPPCDMASKKFLKELPKNYTVQKAKAEAIKKQKLDAIVKKHVRKEKILKTRTYIVFDVKPKTIATNLTMLEHTVRHLRMEGLVWGASKLVPIAFGIRKLSIKCILQGSKLSADTVIERLQKFDDCVQSVDIAYMRKL